MTTENRTDWEAIESRLRVVNEIACVRRRGQTFALIVFELVSATKSLEQRIEQLEANGNREILPALPATSDARA